MKVGEGKSFIDLGSSEREIISVTKLEDDHVEVTIVQPVKQRVASVAVGNDTARARALALALLEAVK